MSDDGTGLVEAPKRLERIVGDLRGACSGPTLIVMAGIHGNEPAGLRATQRVLARLDEARPLRCGLKPLPQPAAHEKCTLPLLRHTATSCGARADLENSRIWH